MHVAVCIVVGRTSNDRAGRKKREEKGKKNETREGGWSEGKGKHGRGVSRGEGCSRFFPVSRWGFSVPADRSEDREKANPGADAPRVLRLRQLA